MDYKTKQALRLLRATRHAIMALKRMPDPSVRTNPYNHAAASYHARRAWNALDTLQTCWHPVPVYSALLQEQIDRLYLVSEDYEGASV